MSAPRPGELIYIPTREGSDPFQGGVCTIDAVYTPDLQDRILTAAGLAPLPRVLQELTPGGSKETWVTVREDPDSWFQWEGYLAVHQEEWRKEYGSRPGRAR